MNLFMIKCHEIENKIISYYAKWLALNQIILMIDWTFSLHIQVPTDIDWYEFILNVVWIFPLH